MRAVPRVARGVVLTEDEANGSAIPCHDDGVADHHTRANRPRDWGKGRHRVVIVGGGFAGLYAALHTVASATLGGVGGDARYLAERMGLIDAADVEVATA